MLDVNSGAWYASTVTPSPIGRWTVPFSDQAGLALSRCHDLRDDGLVGEEDCTAMEELVRGALVYEGLIRLLFSHRRHLRLESSHTGMAIVVRRRRVVV